RCPRKVGRGDQALVRLQRDHHAVGFRRGNQVRDHVGDVDAFDLPVLVFVDRCESSFLYKLGNLHCASSSIGAKHSEASAARRITVCPSGRRRQCLCPCTCRCCCRACTARR